MPDAQGRIKGISLTGKAGEQLERMKNNSGSCPFCHRPNAGELCDDDHCREPGGPLSEFTQRLGGAVGC